MKILGINYLKTYGINGTIYKQNITIDKELMDLYNKHLEYLKNKIRHTQKQSGTTTHSNKKTSLKITNKTKQKGKTTHKKILFITYL